MPVGISYDGEGPLLHPSDGERPGGGILPGSEAGDTATWKD